MFLALRFGVIRLASSRASRSWNAHRSHRSLTYATSKGLHVATLHLQTRHFSLQICFTWLHVSFTRYLKAQEPVASQAS